MIFRIMLQFAARYNGAAPRKNLHIIRRYAKFKLLGYGKYYIERYNAYTLSKCC